MPFTLACRGHPLEDEIANPGDWRTTVVGRMPVVVARDNNGSIAAFENRCAPRRSDLPR